MRFYTQKHRYHRGVDLHARSMYVCILDQRGEIVLHKNLPAGPGPFLKAIAPFREDLVVAAECMFAWYWLADRCAQEQIPFVLGHAPYMKAIHGWKVKNDRVDSHKIAGLLRGGMLPQAYVCPPEMRSTRDLLRRRCYTDGSNVGPLNCSSKKTLFSAIAVQPFNSKARSPIKTIRVLMRYLHWTRHYRGESGRQEPNHLPSCCGCVSNARHQRRREAATAECRSVRPAWAWTYGVKVPRRRTTVNDVDANC
jgi:hypothetical protein